MKLYKIGLQAAPKVADAVDKYAREHAFIPSSRRVSTNPDSMIYEWEVEWSPAIGEFLKFLRGRFDNDREDDRAYKSLVVSETGDVVGDGNEPGIRLFGVTPTYDIEFLDGPFGTHNDDIIVSSEIPYGITVDVMPGNRYMAKKSSGSIRAGDVIQVEKIEDGKILVNVGPYALTQGEFMSIVYPAA